jgi:transposase
LVAANSLIKLHGDDAAIKAAIRADMLAARGDGDGYLRRLLISGAQSVLLRTKTIRPDSWLAALLGRRPRLVVAVALANKTARIAWAIMMGQDSYRRAAAAV